MKQMKRNLVPIYYCLYKEKQPILDEEGYETGEQKIVYEKPVKFMCTVSPATGFAQANTFGNLESYDKVLITEDMTCPINENTVLFIDSEPGYRHNKPTYDYIVRRVAKSLNFIFYAVSKVNVS